MTPHARKRAEFLAREVARLMDMGVPKNLPFETWLADYFMRFAQDEFRREAEARPLAPGGPA
jgi:hypothetical protein